MVFCEPIHNYNDLLYRACAEGDCKAAVKLLKNPKINVNAQQKNGTSALHMAALEGKRQIVQIF